MKLLFLKGFHFEYLLTEISKHMDDNSLEFLDALLPWSDKRYNLVICRQLWRLFVRIHIIWRLRLILYFTLFFNMEARDITVPKFFWRYTGFFFEHSAKI